MCQRAWRVSSWPELASPWSLDPRAAHSAWGPHSRDEALQCRPGEGCSGHHSTLSLRLQCRRPWLVARGFLYIKRLTVDVIEDKVSCLVLPGFGANTALLLMFTFSICSNVTCNVLAGPKRFRDFSENSWNNSRVKMKLVEPDSWARLTRCGVLVTMRRKVVSPSVGILIDPLTRTMPPEIFLSDRDVTKFGIDDTLVQFKVLGFTIRLEWVSTKSIPSEAHRPRCRGTPPPLWDSSPVPDRTYRPRRHWSRSAPVQTPKRKE